MKTAYFRFYGDLNDFLPPTSRQKICSYQFWGNPTLREACAAQGIAPPEIFFILINKEPVAPGYNLQGGERVAVYPRWRSISLPETLEQQPTIPDPPCFLVADHLFKLARFLRILGFDAILFEKYDPQRILLTRKLHDLKAGAVRYGYLPRSENPYQQLQEVMDYFELAARVEPGTRCPECNGKLQEVDAGEIWERLEPLTKKYYRNFKICPDCDKIYWRGSHLRRLNRWIGPFIPGEENNNQR